MYLLKKILRIFLLVLVFAFFIGGGVLIVWDVPPPLIDVEKVIPNDRFPD